MYESQRSIAGSSSTITMDEKLRAALARIEELEEENEQLKRQAIEVNMAKELYLKIFEDFPALIWRSRLDKLCDYFNRTWLEWTGKSIDEEFGMGWAKGVHPDDFDRCVETYVKAFDNREPFYMEYRLKDKFDRYRWIGDHGRPFYDLDGQTFLGYIGSCYDITENKENEQKLIKLNATKGRFFSIVAHDLRNPIATFVSLSEFLMESSSSSSSSSAEESDGDGFTKEELAEIAQEMHKDSLNTLNLLENLLDWSKAQSTDIKFQPRQLIIQDLFQQVISQVDMIAKAKKITVSWSILRDDDDDNDNNNNAKAVDALAAAATETTTSSTTTVFADHNMMNAILRNLVVNAIKFTYKGGKIQLKATRRKRRKTTTMTTFDNGMSSGYDHCGVQCGSERSHYGETRTKEEEEEEQAQQETEEEILFQVRDDGIGMTNGEIQDLFELDKSSRSRPGTEDEGGSGLGLVMCKDFVEEHHCGIIWAESQVNNGTTFNFIIPQLK